MVLLLNVTAMARVLPLSQSIINDMTAKGTYTKDCPVSPQRLREVRFDYYDFSDSVHNDGSIIVMDAVADEVDAIFAELYQQHFPIHKARRIEYYNGDDDASMRDNNTSSFNCRAITGTSGNFSIHAYGLAIDVNPVQNPYVSIDTAQGSAQVTPEQSWRYLNRDNQEPGMVESIAELFSQHGFGIWGGHWHEPIDWQHFQPSRVCSQMLALMLPTDAQQFFQWYKEQPDLWNQMSSSDESFTTFYQQDNAKFMRIYTQHHNQLNLASPEEAKTLFAQWWDLL